MRPQPVRVAIDLETTGLHPEQDAVIEIGALKFAGEQVIDTFESFVATSASIPYRVQRLTGIKPAQLRQAPALSELTPRLRAFLGDLPLVGHSVPFDVAFLRRAGLARHNPLVDTYELATTLLPNLSSYTLGAVGVALGCSSPTYHRALADAQLSRDVFLALLERLEALDGDVLQSLGQLAAPSDWTPAFFVRTELRARGAARQRAGGAGGFGGTLGEQLAAKLGMNPDMLAREVTPDADPVSTSRTVAVAEEPDDEKGATFSPEMEVVASAITDCFDSGESLLAEIESDGESRQGCLIAALRWAERHDEPVLISAPTRDAMSHLASVALPRALVAAGIEPSRLPIANIDRSDAYLCLHRWHGVARDARNSVISRDLARGLAKLAVWAGETQTGRRSEVAIVGSDEAAWERARSGDDFRDAFASCAYHRDGSCFTDRARETASQARIVVTTHAALAARLAGAESLLPDAKRVLVLDGHLLEEELRSAQGNSLDRQEIAALLDTLACVETENHRAGLLHVAAQRAGSQGGSQEQAWFALVQRARESVEALFQALQKVMREAAGSQDNSATGETSEQLTLRVDGKIRQLRSWQQAASAWATVSQQCDELGKVAREAARLPVSDHGKKAGGLAADGVAGELFGCARALERLCQRGAALVEPQDPENTVRWLRLPYPSGPVGVQNGSWQRRDRRGGKHAAPSQASGQRAPSAATSTVSGASFDDSSEAGQTPVAYCAPVQVGELLAPLWQSPRAFALTGPALAIAGDFTFLRGSLGLPEHLVSRSLGGDREQQTLLCLPEDVPEPNVSQYQRHLDDALVALATGLGGRLVALFPSHAALRSSAQNIRRILEQRDILVMAQGQDGSARQLWQTFRSEERVVLLGAGAFWDGAEQVERPPACVVVARTPFPTMSDPLLSARADQWHDQQADFIVPHAALRVRQALSGLAWSHRQRNAVVLFDRRLQTRAYGPTILGTLPRCTQLQGSMEHIVERVGEWLG